MKFNSYIKAMVFKNENGTEMEVRENITYLHVKINNYSISEFKGKVTYLNDNSFILVNKEGKTLNISFCDIEEMYYYNPNEEYPIVFDNIQKYSAVYNDFKVTEEQFKSVSTDGNKLAETDVKILVDKNKIKEIAKRLENK